MRVLQRVGWSILAGTLIGLLISINLLPDGSTYYGTVGSGCFGLGVLFADWIGRDKS